MPLDEQLISHSNSQKNEADNSESDSSSARSASLREAVRGSSSPESQGDIRADRMAAFRRGGTEGLKDKVATEILSPAKQGTSNLLKAAWENLIDTFGLTLIWIDIHIFLRQVLGKDLFCSLGEEWLPKGAPKNIEGAKKMVGMTEGMGVACLNLGCLFMILGTLSLIAMIVSGVENPLGSISEIFGDLWRAVTGGSKSASSTTSMLINTVGIISNNFYNIL